MERQDGLWLFHLESPGRPMELENCWQICLLAAGWGRINTPQLAATISRGQLLLIPPNHPSGLEFEAGSQWYQLFLTPELMKSSMEESPLALPREPVLLRISQDGQNRMSLLLTMLAEEESGQEQYADRARECLLGLMMVWISRATAPCRPNGGELIPMVLDYIEEHYGEPLNLEQLAASFYVSKYYLSHLFSKKTGISLFRYLTQKRLMEARQLLARGVPPSEVCQRCGFGDYANFYRAFKEQFGQSPRDFSGKENGR